MISVENLQKVYDGRTVLDIPRLEIRSGEIFGLVGNNGAGKTTLLRLLLDLIRADAGQVLMEGKNVRGSDHWKYDVGSFLDESFLIDYLTPLEYFDFVGDIYGLSREESRRRFQDFGEFLNNDIHTTGKLIRELSQGTRKKIGIVSAVSLRPRLLILDEPFAHLDPSSQFRLQDILRGLSNDSGCTMVISSHNLEHVSAVCSRIAILEEGQIIYDAPVRENTLEEMKQYFAV